MLSMKLESLLPPSLPNWHKISSQGFQRRRAPEFAPLPWGPPFWFSPYFYLLKSFWFRVYTSASAEKAEDCPKRLGPEPGNEQCCLKYLLLESHFILWGFVFFFLICKMGTITPNLLGCYEDINCQILGLTHSTCSESKDTEWPKSEAGLTVRLWLSLEIY